MILGFLSKEKEDMKSLVKNESMLRYFLGFSNAGNEKTRMCVTAVRPEPQCEPVCGEISYCSLGCTLTGSDSVGLGQGQEFAVLRISREMLLLLFRELHFESY